ncbi:MAG: hypothetical protein AAFX79_08075 [Planctomycetota bacterium]
MNTSASTSRPTSARPHGAAPPARAAAAEIHPVPIDGDAPPADVRPRSSDGLGLLVILAAHGLAFAAGIAGVLAGAVGPTFGLPAGLEGLAYAGLIAMVLAVVLAPISVGVLRVVRGLRETHEAAVHATLALRALGEQAALSDDARRVLNRGRDRTLLRRAIEEDIAREDWEAALVLADELAHRFGYRQDAEDFRRRIDRARHVTLEAQLDGAMARLDAMVLDRQWDEARREAARVARTFDDSPRAQAAGDRVQREFERFRADLERQFLEAAEDERVDEAMQLLRRLDQFLTEDDAEPLREVARGIIGKARENLGAKFKLAVKDKRWVEAAQVGERIIAEFPNSRMAAEVRELLDGIRDRASKIVLSSS